MNPRACSHEALKEMTDAAQPAGAQAVADEWARMAAGFDEAATLFERATQHSEGGWTGSAAEAMRGQLAQVAAWSRQAGAHYQAAAEAITSQAEAANVAKTTMPPPVPYDPARMIREAAASGNVSELAALPHLLHAQKQRSDAAHEEAVRVVTERDGTFGQSVAAIPAFEPPPRLSEGGGRIPPVPAPPAPPLPPAAPPGPHPAPVSPAMSLPVAPLAHPAPPPPPPAAPPGPRTAPVPPAMSPPVAPMAHPAPPPPPRPAPPGPRPAPVSPAMSPPVAPLAHPAPPPPNRPAPPAQPASPQGPPRPMPPAVPQPPVHITPAQVVAASLPVDGFGPGGGTVPGGGFGPTGFGSAPVVAPPPGYGPAASAMAPGAGTTAPRAEDGERKRPEYLVESDLEGMFGSTELTAPPVIGQE
ncbi:PPE domain-containing protein [Actinophytocola sp.]|uniref:PPE domain-containing protein n=1 Tax=Actinophytocola sp. TaxID=1872138 RepID=UPI002D800E7F|nr:PPE domain-containing protein [Actinophytocola sp.]HET9139893.1 PPE domain-containing protein [Actinophytocola sp.]